MRPAVARHLPNAACADGNDHQEVTVALWEVDDHSKTAVDILSRSAPCLTWVPTTIQTGFRALHRVVTGQRRVLKPNEHPVQVQVQTVSQVHNIMDIAAATGLLSSWTARPPVTPLFVF